MRVLLTGAGGQVGQALTAAAPAGVELIACTRDSLDISDARSVATIIRRYSPAVVVNAAAYTAVDRAESEEEQARAVNEIGARNLACEASAAKARLIHISTDFVFSGSSSVPYRPDSPPHPLGVYGATKLAGESAVLQHTDEAVVLRTAWLYAAQGRNFVRTMLRLMQTHGEVRVVSDQVGTPTAARSVAEAIWRIIAMPEIRGIHHWTDAGVASWYDFATAIASEGTRLGLLTSEPTVTPIATADYPTPARRPSYSVLDARSLTTRGFVPIHWYKRLRSVMEEMQHA